MKSSIECCHLWNVRDDLLDRCNTIQAGWVVERGQLCQFFNRQLNFRRDTHRGGVALAAMDNAMSHSSELVERVQSRRRASLQIVENPSRGISMLFQL